MNIASNAHRRSVRAAATGLTMVAIVGLAATAAVAADRSLRTEHLFVVEGAPLLIDEDVAGFSAGDTLLFDDEVRDPDTNGVVGDAVTRVTIVRELGEDALFLLDCTVRTDAGNLAFYGSGQFSQLGTGVAFVVTGGTGVYAGVNGTVTIVGAELEGTPGSDLAFAFSRP